MEPDEIIETLRHKGISISRSTLINYEKAKLIPYPDRGGFGRGRGRYTYYDENVPKIVYSIHHMASARRLTFWDLEKIVRNADVFENNPNKFLSGLETLNFSFIDQAASMSVVYRDIVAPILRFVCLKEHFCYGMPEQGLQIIYDIDNNKTVNSLPSLYTHKITYGDVVIEDFTFRLPLLPIAAIPSNEGLWISEQY